MSGICPSAPRCTAHRTDGVPCKGLALKGMNVCRVHGGYAPQVRRRAEERLAALEVPAIGVLDRAIRRRKIDAQSIAAAREILDRTRGKPVQRTEVTGSEGAPLDIMVRFTTVALPTGPEDPNGGS